MSGRNPLIAIIGTGGTIASVGKDALDTLDYSATGQMLNIATLLESFPEVKAVADVVSVEIDPVPSTRMFFPQWRSLISEVNSLVREYDELGGIVITHGTATLEETAYFLNLTLRVDVPVVFVGAQRPVSALSSDAGMNLVNAVRVAASPAARGLGVMVMLNDEIHAAREVTKTATHRLQTFRSPEFGLLGTVDGDAVTFYRTPVRRHMPDTEFDVTSLESLPRVDIAYAYAGTDGTAVRAFLDAGAQGIVCAGFAPGFVGPAEREPLERAVERGVVVVVSTRVGSGRVLTNTFNAKSGFLSADNLNPQKARILLSLCLTVSNDRGEIERIFAEY